jgi:hypothetical protein
MPLELHGANTFLSNLRKRCDKLDSHPYLQDILLDGIDAWFNQSDFDYTGYPSIYHQLYQEQARIGWRHIFNGRFSEEWAYLQDNYLYTQKKHQGRDDGNNWTTAVICEC